MKRGCADTTLVHGVSHPAEHARECDERGVSKAIPPLTVDLVVQLFIKVKTSRVFSEHDTWTEESLDGQTAARVDDVSVYRCVFRIATVEEVSLKSIHGAESLSEDCWVYINIDIARNYSEPPCV